MAVRRLLTVPLVLASTVLLLGSALIWLPVMALLALLPPLRHAWRGLAFLTAFLACESAGILVALWLWLRHGLPRRDGPRWAAFLDGNFRLQCWWAATLKRAAVALYRLRFEVRDAEAFEGPAAIVMPRHVSIGDTVVPLLFYAVPQRLRLRYVLKQELQFDPCLDIVGNRLPNAFVDRASDDPAREIGTVRALVAGLGPRAGTSVVIYPEGTRATASRRARVQALLANKGAADVQALAAQLQHVLPPRTGGALALLQANPGLDLLFLAHTGFEGSSHFATMFNGGWLDTRVVLQPWRIPAADLPADAAGQRALLLDQWQRMDRTVAALQTD